MIRRVALLIALCAAVAEAQTRQANPPAKPAKPQAAEDSSTEAVQERVQAYLRKLYAWGPAFRVKLGPLNNSLVPGFYEVNVEVTAGQQLDSGMVYVSKDGRYLFRGDMQDMLADPLAAVRSQIRLENNPSKGPANARVVVVEYSDFQCPSCRQLYQTFRAIVPNYPQVRFVFKDFPLTQIHPWAMTAATAGRCAYKQNAEAFWKLHDSLFDNQEVISPQNAWQKLIDFAGQAGLDVEAFKTCLASPEAAQAVMENVKEGQALKLANTPTVFVNGRRMIGGDRGLLEQYIQYELAAHAPPRALKPQQ